MNGMALIEFTQGAMVVLIALGVIIGATRLGAIIRVLKQIRDLLTAMKSDTHDTAFYSRHMKRKEDIEHGDHGGAK